MVALTSPNPDDLTQVVATVGGVLRQTESWTAGIVDSFGEILIGSLDVLLELYSSRHLRGAFDEMKALVKVNGEPLHPTAFGECS